MSDLHNRNLLYARLEEVLGTEPAGILMDYLPPQSSIATRSDIDGVSAAVEMIRERVDGLDIRMDRIERHMERFDERLHGFHDALREQTRHFIFATTGSMVTLTGVAFGAAALL